MFRATILTWEHQHLIQTAHGIGICLLDRAEFKSEDFRYFRVLRQLKLDLAAGLYCPEDDFTMTRSRRFFTAQEKASVVKRYLVDVMIG